jgi:tetratricopeptide (TPR) repeat protein
MSRSAYQSGRALLWLGLVTLLIYVNGLQNGFVWDDRTMIFPSSSTASMASGKNIAQGDRLLQRPLMLLSFQVDRLLYGRNPAGFHLTNLLLHLGIVLIFAGVVRSLLGSEIPALIAGALFVLHPVHSEAVSALLGRSDLLVGLFSLLGLWAYRKRSPLFSLVFGLLFFLLAIASKESGLATLGLFVWYDLCFRRSEGRRLWIRWLPLLALVLLAIPVYLFLLQRNPWLVVASLKWWGGTPYHTFLMMLTVVWEYARLLFFPISLSPWYVTPAVTTVLHWKVIAGLAVFLAVLVLLVWSYRKQPLLSFGLGWMFSALLPVSNLVPIPGSMMAERWLYVPSMGFCLLGGMALDWVWTKLVVPRGSGWRLGGIAAGIIVAILMGWQTVRSNAVWRDDETLFRRVIERFPDSFKGHANLGKTLLDQGRMTEAKGELRKAVALKSDSPFPFHWLGEVCLREGKLDSAQAAFSEAIRKDSTFYPAYLSLGGLHRQAGMADSALAVYAEGLRHVQSAELYNNYGIQLVEHGSLPDGIQAYQQAVRVDPGYAPAYHNMGNAYRSLGDFPEAEASYRQALRVDPALAEAHHALGMLYGSQGRYPEAVREMEMAVKERPGELGFEIALARIYAAAGDPSRAIEAYDRILSSNPALGFLVAERDSLKKQLSSRQP